MKTRSPFLNAIADYMLNRHYSHRTVETCLKWISSYIHFHENLNPERNYDLSRERSR